MGGSNDWGGVDTIGEEKYGETINLHSPDHWQKGRRGATGPVTRKKWKKRTLRGLCTLKVKSSWHGGEELSRLEIGPGGRRCQIYPGDWSWTIET